MLLKEFYKQRTRHILTIISIFLSLCILIVIDTITINLESSLNEQMNHLDLKVKSLTVYNKPEEYKRVLKKHSKKFISYYYQPFYDFNLVGIDHDLLDLFDISVYGESLKESDINQNANFVLLGYDAYKYYGKPEIGEVIYIQSLPFQVVGVIEEGRENVFIDFNQAIYIPIDYVGEDVIKSFYFISEENIEAFLNFNHDYFLVDQSSTEEGFQFVISFIGKLLRFLSLFSFVIASIGMLNNSLSNLKSRVKEIALKRSLGASERDIYLYMLLENFLLTLIAIMSSVIISISLMKLIDKDIIIYFDKLFAKVIFIFIYSLSISCFSSYRASKITINEALKS